MRTIVSRFRDGMRSTNQKQCLKLIRSFLDDIGNPSAGVRLVENRRQIASFLENDMDLLNKDERYRVYGFLEALLPKQYKRILIARAHKEADSKCLEVVQAILQIRTTNRE